jgi:hypothetical protein
LLSCTLLGLVFCGCDPVREDRRIEFTASGDQVAFQHGSDGIFVADPKSGELHKVFDPDPAVIAVSTPNWSDDETRAIFTTARDASRPDAAAAGATPAGSAAQPPAWEDAPTGRLFGAEPIAYTCWLVERKQNGISKPVSLFDARCDHSGYVAANLAVRWDAKGKRVFFIAEDAPLTHAVWVYDMERQDKRRLFPPNGQTTGHVVFDLLGDGRHIVCVASGDDMASSLSLTAEPKRGERHPAASTSRPPSSVAGIWLGSLEGANWWHIPESQHSEQENVPQGLSTLIAHRPVCSKDGRQLAFVVERQRDKDSLVASLFRVRVSDKKVDKLFTTAGDIHDLRWSSDGSRLGFVLGEPKTSTLHVVDAAGHVQKPLRDPFIREFAGWNATGDKLAVVSEIAPADPSSTQFGLLLIPNPLAHDAVLIVDEKGVERTLLSGLQFTFPQWSPKREQLSMWGTYQPSHLALTSEMGGGLGLGIGLRRGDPAAIVDVSTGSVRWLAINGDEMAQVGHYYLSKHDPAQAREWYRKADKLLPKLESLRPEELIHGLSGSAARRRTFEFFYYLCLSELNESQEAAQRLALFDGAHRIDWPAAPQSTVPTPAAKTAAPVPNPPATASAFWPAESRRDGERLVAIAKALSIAQIFLSTDQPDAAQTWFSQRLAAANSDEKLADLTALSQLLLLAKRNQEFATLATDRLAPLLITKFDDPPTDSNAQPDSPLAVRRTLAVLTAHTFGPLFDEAFLKQLPPDFVSQLVPKWEALRTEPHGRLASLYVDLFLHAAAARLGHDKERMAAKARIAGNPFSAPGALGGQLEVYLGWLRPPAQPQRSGQL